MKPTPDRDTYFPSQKLTDAIRLSRRRLAFYLGFGLFAIGERLRADAFDEFAAALMEASDTALNSTRGNLEAVPSPGAGRFDAGEEPPIEHWTFEENGLWYWYERQTYEREVWKSTGRTLPIHKHTGLRAPMKQGYLPDDAVPPHIRRPPPAPRAESSLHQQVEGEAGHGEADDTISAAEPGLATADRRARHGRPPSRWLRSLRPDELRTWLSTIEVPEAGVSGMSFWLHLTRDHFFDPERIVGLNTQELAKLHAAAHYGY